MTAQEINSKTLKSTEPASPIKATALAAPQITGVAGQSRDRLISDVAIGGLVSNARTLMNFSASGFGKMSLVDTALSIGAAATEIHGGDLRAAETMLTAQAIALDSVFSELARRAALNIGEHLGATETYMKLALKAQGQCRATLVALAEIKNPPVLFARQLNVANGPQQVNNGSAPAHSAHSAQAPAGAHAGQTASLQNELLEQQHGNFLDTRTQGLAIVAGSHLAAVGEINRPAN